MHFTGFLAGGCATTSAHCLAGIHSAVTAVGINSISREGEYPPEYQLAIRQTFAHFGMLRNKLWNPDDVNKHFQQL